MVPGWDGKGIGTVQVEAEEKGGGDADETAEGEGAAGCAERAHLLYCRCNRVTAPISVGCVAWVGASYQSGVWWITCGGLHVPTVGTLGRRRFAILAGGLRAASCVS